MAEKKQPAQPQQKQKQGKGRKMPTKASAYKIDGAKISKIKKECPRCGAGTFMAHHKDRSYCGRCHYTEFSQPPAQKQPSQQQQQQSPQHQPAQQQLAKKA